MYFSFHEFYSTCDCLLGSEKFFLSVGGVEPVSRSSIPWVCRELKEENQMTRQTENSIIEELLKVLNLRESEVVTPVIALSDFLFRFLLTHRDRDRYLGHSHKMREASSAGNSENCFLGEKSLK
jgi:hypothetical protein